MPDRYIVIHRVPPHPIKPTPAEIVDTGGLHALVVGYFPDRKVALRCAELLNLSEEAATVTVDIEVDVEPLRAQLDALRDRLGELERDRHCPEPQEGPQLPADDLTPAERTLRARAAAHASWANTPDPAERTAPARRAFLDRFEREVDPDGLLDPAERTRRAEHARKAYFTGLALKSAKARARA